MITADPHALARWDGASADLVDACCDLDAARTYADGRSSYLVRNPNHPDRMTVACFDRPLQFEADLVLLQQATGALIVQRTPVFGVSRVFTDDRVISWNGRSWTGRATAQSLLPDLLARAPDLDQRVAEGMLTLAIHWLAPARTGATLVVHDDYEDSSLDRSGATPGPGLTITDRRHYPPLLSTLMQRDLATLIDPRGDLHALGVGLRASDTAQATVNNEGGMRHRSAQRWSHDHPRATVTVVSADGPVTVYRGGITVIGAQ
jgi:DNA integrity scanning protein DisA with diadenylate cyclase activity